MSNACRCTRSCRHLEGQAPTLRAAVVGSSRRTSTRGGELDAPTAARQGDGGESCELTHHECDNTSAGWSASPTASATRPVATREPVRRRPTTGSPASSPTSRSTFFKQMAESVRRGHDGADGDLPGMPLDPCRGRRPDRRAFRACRRHAQQVLPARRARKRTFEYPRRSPIRAATSLHVVPDYGHLDMFIGEAPHRDVFPQILQELAGMSSPKASAAGKPGATPRWTASRSCCR